MTPTDVQTSVSRCLPSALSVTDRCRRPALPGLIAFEPALALRRRFEAGRGLPEPVKALEGKSALVLDRVGQHEGQVKLDGEVWTARPLDDNDVYEPGDHVTVVRIDGATAVVFKAM